MDLICVLIRLLRFMFFYAQKNCPTRKIAQKIDEFFIDVLYLDFVDAFDIVIYLLCLY